MNNTTKTTNNNNSNIMKTIEFISTADTNITTTKAASPWARPTGITFGDQILKPEYRARKLRFNAGPNWLRVVPAMEGPADGWMLPIFVNNYPGGRIVHPTTLKPNARNAFDYAHKWLRAHHPESLYTKDNKAGIRVLTDPMALFFVIVEEEGRNVVRFLLCSGYDGSRGGTPGLGCQLLKASREYDENGALVMDAIDHPAGRRFCVEKSQAKGAAFPSYHLKVGSTPAPMQPLVESLAPEEQEVLTPLPNVIEEVDIEEQWKCLGTLIAKEHLEKIRASLK